MSRHIPMCGNITAIRRAASRALGGMYATFRHRRPRLVAAVTLIGIVAAAAGSPASGLGLSTNAMPGVASLASLTDVCGGASATVIYAPATAIVGVGTPAVIIASPVAGQVSTPVASAAATSQSTTSVVPTDRAVTIEVGDMFFDPTEATVPADVPIELTLTNTGAAPHAFIIDALGVVVPLEPGQTATVTITAAPGSYEFYDCLPGHREAGMVGRLVAVSGGTPEAARGVLPRRKG